MNGKKLMMAAAGGGAASVEYVGYAGTSGNQTIDISGISLQEGDLVIAVYTGDGGGFIEGPSGYTGMHSDYPGDGNEASIAYQVGYKFMGSTPDTSITTQADVTGLRSQAYAFRNAGAPSGTPDSTALDFQFAYIRINSVTVPDDGSAIAYFGTVDDDFVDTDVNVSGYTVAGREPVGNRGTTQLGYRLEVPAGTTSQVTADWPTSDSSLTLAWIIPPA